MTKAPIFIASIGVMVFTASAVSAHPGTKILTTGSAGERTVMTSGMSFEEVGAVHVFRGTRTLAGGTPVANETGAQNATININIDNRAFRSFRRLRTQGFYSGTGPKSRRYTQGFYSGD